MKIRRSVYWFVAVVAVLLGFTVWYKKDKHPELPLPTSVETSNSPPASIKPSPAVSIHTPTAPQNKQALLQEVLNANDADIVFFGRLEDQFSNGVAGAEINFSVQYENATTRGILRGQVVSDGSGFFTISGYKGATLGIMPAKSGYALATTGTSFTYTQISPGFFVPDASNPTVIRLWKLQGAEPLVSINRHYKLRYTGETMNFDLLTGQLVPTGGDVKLTVNRGPGVISGRNPISWSVQIEAVDGGLINVADQDWRAYWAPESGYQPSKTIKSSDRLPEGGIGGFHTGFFIKSRNDHVYTKLGLLFSINLTPDEPMQISFDGVANANSSRNWEGDPNTTQTARQ